MRPDERLSIALVAIFLAVGVLTIFPVILGDRVVEPFSELGILGPTGKLGDYPSELVVGDSLELFLYLGNHEGYPVFYRAVAKIGDQETNVTDTSPYPGEEVFSYEQVLGDECNHTAAVSIPIDEAGLNRRLVIELYKYQENQFIYDGLWVQLWLNVTEAR